MRIRRYFIVILLMFLFFSCSSQKATLLGKWENENRNIEFFENTFIIKNKLSESGEGLFGSYSYANEPPNVIKMKYEKIVLQDGSFQSLEGNDLYGYVDNVSIAYNKKQLKVYVIANQKLYVYKKVE